MVRIAKAFDVGVDFITCDDKEAAVGKIKHQELLPELEEINNLSEEDQETVVTLLDAFIKRRKFEQLVHG